MHVSGEKSRGRADGDAGGMGVPPRWRVCVMENLKIRWMMWGHPILGHLSLSIYMHMYVYMYMSPKNGDLYWDLCLDL